MAAAVRFSGGLILSVVDDGSQTQSPGEVAVIHSDPVDAEFVEWTRRFLLKQRWSFQETPSTKLRSTTGNASGTDQEFTVVFDPRTAVVVDISSAAEQRVRVFLGPSWEEHRAVGTSRHQLVERLLSVGTEGNAVEHRLFGSVSESVVVELTNVGLASVDARVALTRSLEDLDTAGQRVVDLIADNARLRGILEAHGIDPDAPARAMAVYRDARGANRWSLVLAAATLVQTLFTVTGALPSWFEEDPRAVVPAAIVQCRQTITVVREAPAELFAPEVEFEDGASESP